MVNIDELKRLDREATQGPWWYWDDPEGDDLLRANEDGDYPTSFDVFVVDGGQIAEMSSRDEQGAANAKLISTIRNNLPAIIGEIETLRARVKELEAKTSIDISTP